MRDADDELSAARLRIAVGRLSKRLRRTAASQALTTTELDVLVAAESQRVTRLTDLAAIAGLNPTMLSRLIPKLETAGLVYRSRDEIDRRASTIMATQKGHRLLERIRSERTDALSRQIQVLGAKDRAALAVAVPILEELAERLLERTSATPSSSS
jgi:DNA-binding MarR family transcriptional regulator